MAGENSILGDFYTPVRIVSDRDVFVSREEADDDVVVLGLETCRRLGLLRTEAAKRLGPLIANEAPMALQQEVDVQALRAMVQVRTKAFADSLKWTVQYALGGGAFLNSPTTNQPEEWLRRELAPQMCRAVDVERKRRALLNVAPASVSEMASYVVELFAPGLADEVLAAAENRPFCTAAS